MLTCRNARPKRPEIGARIGQVCCRGAICATALTESQDPATGSAYKSCRTQGPRNDIGDQVGLLRSYLYAEATPVSGISPDTAEERENPETSSQDVKAFGGGTL